MARCLTITEEIRLLASKLQGETPASVANLVGLWLEKNNKDMEAYPTTSELNRFRVWVRALEAAGMLDEALAPSLAFLASTVSSVEEQAKVDLDFDPRTRRDRVTLLARFFSNEVDRALQEISSSLEERIGKASTVEEANELRKELHSLDRVDAIRKYTPAGIFLRVKDRYFDSYLYDTDEGRIQAELQKINGNPDYDEYTPELKLEGAKKRAEYNKQSFLKISDNFRALAEEASTLLLATEGIRVDPNYVSTKDANLNEDTPEGDSQVDGFADDYSKEESVKDGWMTNFRQVSSHESLSQEVRKVIRLIPRLDYEGFIEEDDLGFERYLDADYVHATLIDKLKDMVTSKDMLPLLKKLEQNKPWVGQITELLELDDKLFSQFYQDFRKDFMPYWIQKKKMLPDGTFKMETIAINKPEGVYYLLDEWRDNYENGTILDDDSVYEKNGLINKENAEKGLRWTEALNNKFINLDTEARLALLNEDRIFNTIEKLLNMLGINANPAILRNVLTTIPLDEVGKSTDPIMLLIPLLNIIFSGISKGEIKSETRADGSEKRGDLINTFGSAYNSIAIMIALVTEDAIESSVRENDKSYYSHVNPNYLGKMIKQLKNVMGDSKSFQDYIDNEFKQYDWFYKDGRWRNDWLAFLESSEEARRGLNHKTVLNSDKVDYTNWDGLDYTLALLTEYWGDPESSKSKTDWAWYHVPILSDAPSAEFIRFRKYKSGKELGEDGSYRDYDDIILDKLTDLVNLEYDRIKLVRARDEQFQQGNPNVSPIANYDIVRAKDGSIKSLGGAEFKFLTSLNNIKYDNGETFLDRLARMSNESSGDELRDFIRGALRETMDDGFEQSYRDWSKMGLFEELPNGKMKYLPFQGQSQSNEITARALNKAKAVMEGSWTTDMELLLRDFNNNLPVDNRLATGLFEQINDVLTRISQRNGITLNELNSIKRSLIVKNNSKEALREYYWNSKLATSQIIQLTTTDLAFYKNPEDFQKRFKEIHAPSLRMNTQATFKGEKIGRDWERTIYLKDDEIISPALQDIETVLDERVAKGEMTKTDRNNIVQKFKEVNVADAQAYRSLSSYRAMLGMSGQWNDDMETAYNNFKEGKWNIKDFNMLWQPKKPFVYTQVYNMSGIDGTSGIKTPVQHKNSEYLLMAMHLLIAGPLGKSGKLKAINEFMEENQIDVVQFESTTKVGKQGVIDINGVNDLNEVKRVLKETTMPEGIENPNIVHKISYEDYGIQIATPEHAIDAVQLVGTLIRKLITSDIAEGTILEVNGKQLTKLEWLDLYNAINTENIIQSFTDVNEMFSDKKEVEKLLLEEIRGNKRYGIDMLRACTLDANGNFLIPLFDPVQSLRVLTLLNSIIKSRITKQKIRGGALIQLSDYGLTDDLHIIFEGEGANKRIKYLECYMPWYTREYLEPLMNPKDHTLDINKVPEGLRKLIGYRVPTEDKYSMAPLYIKDFLPSLSGSAIMLPAEITTLSGSDFDVDKLYIMLPEFKVKKKYDKRQFITDLISQLLQGSTLNRDEYNLLSKSINDAINNPQDENQKNIRSTYLKNRDKYRVPSEDTIEKIEYDFNKSPQENSLEARNNLLIDMMWGVLTNADTASKILNPGSFDYQKKSARIVTILNSSYESDLKRELNIQNGLSIINKLNSMSLKELDKLAEKSKAKLDPLSPMTLVHFHQLNMTGGKLIGIYANHNANHALMQHTDLGLDAENGSFILNGKRLTSLHDIMNSDKEFISKNNAGYLAASVDNVKDPVLAGLNLNTLTADASMLLSRLGYNPTEVGLLMSQPIVLDITNSYFRLSRDGKTKDLVIDEVLTEYKKKAAIMEDLTYDNYKSNQFLISDLADNILISKEMGSVSDRTQTGDYRKIEYYKKLVAVGYLFQRIMRSADALGQLVLATRSDTQGGAAGPTIADTKLKVQKVQDFLKNATEDIRFPLVGADVIRDDILLDLSVDNIRKELLDSKLPFLQAFYTLGLKLSELMLSKYFPQFNENFNQVIDVIRDMTKSGKLNVKTMNSIYNDLLAYIMSSTSFFGNETKPDGTIITASQKRLDFINNFPEYFKKVVSDNEDIADLEFIKRLRVIKANDNSPVETVVFKNVGLLSSDLRERYMRDWATLLYMNNPKAQELALNLFRYSYYRNGFSFGPSTFIHLAPTAIRLAIPEYISTLNGLVNSDADYSLFVEQYIYNHLDNRRLVPEVPQESLTKFIGEDNEVKDTVTFTIDNSSNTADKKIVRKKIDNGDGSVTYDFFDFIARRVTGGGYAYYRLNNNLTEASNVAEYVRIDPIGYKNSFIEYEWGKDASELKSVIEKNDRNYNPSNINPDMVAYSEPSFTDEDVSDFTDRYSEAYLTDLLNQAYSAIYGEGLDLTTQKSDDITNITPNTDYKDENGDNICGAETLGYL